MIDTGAILHLLNAIDALQDAQTETSNGFVSDECTNAIDTIRKAISMLLAETE